MFVLLNKCTSLCILKCCPLIASDYEVKHPFYQNFFQSHIIQEFLNIYYRKLITLKMLYHENMVIGNIVLVKRINHMLTKPSFPHYFSLLFFFIHLNPSGLQALALDFQGQKQHKTFDPSNPNLFILNVLILIVILITHQRAFLSFERKSVHFLQFNNLKLPKVYCSSHCE